MNREMKFEEYEPFLKENEQAMTEALQKLIDQALAADAG